MLTRTTLALRYTTFAIAATGVNIATQYITTGLYTSSLALWPGIFAGTLTGLVTKYLLDRHWIFFNGRGNFADHSRKFTLYTIMGGITTLIFWVTEWAFDYVSGGDELWRYTGAVVGLSIGYTVKYRLDKRFVFERR